MRKHSYIIAFLASLLLTVSMISGIAPLRNAVSMASVHDYYLAMNWGYLLFSPLFNILDMLTSLSVSQHMACIIAMLSLPLSFTLWTQRKLSPKALSLKLIKTLLLSTLVVVLIYTLAVLLPRPMSALKASNPDMVLVDFHSHTNYSHDANKFFTSEHNRWWHQHAGFNAAFITDHKSFHGAEEAKSNNPRYANDGVLLLNAIECYHEGGHILALCASRDNANEKTYDWQRKEDAHPSCDPLLIQTLPGPVADKKALQARQIAAIEIHDSAPLGLEEIKHRTALLTAARELDIAVLSGSDNHGWGYASMAWSTLRIPHWQYMNADQLSLAITTTIQNQGFSAVTVIERNMLMPAISIFEHLSMPVRLLWHMIQTLSWAEYASWICWIWLLAFLLKKR